MLKIAECHSALIFLVRGRDLYMHRFGVVNAEGKGAMLLTLISLAAHFSYAVSRFFHVCYDCLLFNFPVYKTRWFSAILHMLKWFAGHQIRNVAVS